MDNKIGDIVYQNYTPSQIGVVITVTPTHSGNKVTVKWGTGKHAGKTETSRGWNTFESLVLEHERKAAKHRATLTEIQQQIAAGKFP